MKTFTVDDYEYVWYSPELDMIIVCPKGGYIFENVEGEFQLRYKIESWKTSRFYLVGEL